MRAVLENRAIANKDNGFLPEGSALEGYDASPAPGAYPIERVFALAIVGHHSYHRERISSGSVKCKFQARPHKKAFCGSIQEVRYRMGEAITAI